MKARPKASGCSVRTKAPTRQSGRPAATRRSQVSVNSATGVRADRAPSTSHSVSFSRSEAFMRYAFADQVPVPSSRYKRFAFGRHQGKVRQTKTAETKMLDSGQEKSGETADLRGGLEAADPATLLLSLVQLTGERHWLEAAKPYIRGPMNYQ